MFTKHQIRKKRKTPMSILQVNNSPKINRSILFEVKPTDKFHMIRNTPLPRREKSAGKFPQGWSSGEMVVEA